MQDKSGVTIMLLSDEPLTVKLLTLQLASMDFSTLDMCIVTEGEEDQEDWDFVLQSSCDMAPYRAGLGVQAALAEIEQGSGTLYDSRVAQACLKIFRQDGYAIPV